MEERPARGGFAPGPILTGIVVAFGSMAIFSGLIGGLLLWARIDEAAVARDNTVEIGIGIAAIFVIAQFVSYLWGGYTAGRMARGMGMLNGILVPVGALLIGAAIAGLASLAGASVRGLGDLRSTYVPVGDGVLATFSLVTGIVGLLAMLAGGLLGGRMGARWHERLERRTDVEHRADRAA